MERWGKNFKRNLILILVTAFWGSLAVGFAYFCKISDKRLHLVFCDVGQGDAIYLKTPQNFEVLIDGGPDEKVLDCLSSRRPFWDRKIDLLILTHPEADHLTGLLAVLERYQVDYLITENIFNPSAVFARFQKAVQEENLQIFSPKAGDRIKLGETEIRFFWPPAVIGKPSLWVDKNPPAAGETKFGESSNDYSLVFNLQYKNFSALQTGDAESSILAKTKSDLPQIAVLKVPHHGSKKALDKEILQIVKPQLAVISVGKKNRFGHPTGETLKILRDLDIKTLRT